MNTLNKAVLGLGLATLLIVTANAGSFISPEMMANANANKSDKVVEFNDSNYKDTNDYSTIEARGNRQRAVQNAQNEYNNSLRDARLNREAQRRAAQLRGSRIKANNKQQTENTKAYERSMRALSRAISGDTCNPRSKLIDPC